jgi:DNA-binding Lrp family transcriptional regulator
MVGISETSRHPSLAYVLIATEPGKARAVAGAISGLRFSGCKVFAVDLVVGPFDIIAKLQAQDIETLGRAMFCGIREIPGVLEVVASCCIHDPCAPERTRSAPVAADVAVP